MDALTNMIVYQSFSMKADTLQGAYECELTKDVMDMEAEFAVKELEMLPQIPKGEYIDVYA